MTKHFIKIASDFTPYPGARDYDDGPDSGLEFYDKILLPAFSEAFESKQILTVDLDGAEGYATSFLDEAFSNLSKKFGADYTWKHLKIISTEEPDWIEEIKSYIYDAQSDK